MATYVRKPSKICAHSSSPRMNLSTSARNARSTTAAAVSPDTKKAIRRARKAIIDMAARDVIKLKLAGEGYGAYPKIINRNKAVADITLEQLKGAVRRIEALEAPMDLTNYDLRVLLESVAVVPENSIPLTETDVNLALRLRQARNSQAVVGAVAVVQQVEQVSVGNEIMEGQA